MSDDLTISVCLDDVRLSGYHGVFEQEAALGNDFMVNLEVRYSSNIGLMTTDDIGSTISYADLYEIVKEQMAIRSALLETVAARILDNVHTRWPRITAAKVKIRKVRVPIAGIDGSASVELSARF